MIFNRVYAKSFLYMVLLILPSLAFSSEPAPTLIAHDLQGNYYDLASQKGKVVVVNFWASWCGACIEEMPRLNAFYQQNKVRGLEIVGISIDRGKGIERARQLAGQVVYPVIIAKEAETNDFPAPAVLPYFYIIDKNGFIAHIINPEEESISLEAISRILEPLLNADSRRK